MTEVTLSDPHHVPVTFVNQLIGSGTLHGVFNFTFATARFTPSTDGKVEPDLVISARLRMDAACLDQLYDTIGRLIQQQQPAQTN